MNPGPRPTTLERWLRRVVKAGAVRIRCVMSGADPQLVKVDTKGAKPRVASMQRTIEALGDDVERLEGLDASNEILDTWQLTDPETAVELPGYLKDAEDTKEERLLKTFAHLLADAYKHGMKQLVETVSLQSQSFAEERRHLSGALSASDRLLSRMSRRVRVATEDDDEGPSKGEDDNQFLMQLLAPALQRMMHQEARAAQRPAAPPATPSNGKEPAP